MGLMVGSTFNLWDVMAGSIPFMSEVVQAKVDAFCFRKLMIARCILFGEECADSNYLALVRVVKCDF